MPFRSYYFHCSACNKVVENRQFLLQLPSLLLLELFWNCRDLPQKLIRRALMVFG